MTRHQWSPGELVKAHAMRAAGDTLHRIGFEIGRSARAVAVKLSRFAPDGTRADHRPRMTTKTLVAELKRRGYTCIPPEQTPARIDL